LACQTSIAQDSRRVKEFLKERGWTVTKLAGRFGVGQAHISNILAGRDRPRVLQIAIADLVDQAPQRLWGLLWYGAGSSARPLKTDSPKNRRAS